MRGCVDRSILLAGVLFCLAGAASGQVLSVSCTPSTGPTTAGVAYSTTCTASGGIAPYSWSISAGTLPAGLTGPAPSGDTTTATIAGTPTASGSYAYTVQVTDSTPVIPMTATQSFSGTIAPNITSISPTSATAGAPAFTLTVNGAGFGSDSAVSFNGAPLTTTVINSGQVTAAVPASAIATPGSVSVTLTSGGATSNSATFTINPPPVITTISPTSTTAGGAAFTLTVNGSGFGADSQVNFNSNALTPSSITANKVVATVPASLITTAGTVPVTVTSGGVTSNSANFAIDPSIASISPATATAGGPAFTLTVNGTGFTAGAEVQWNGSALATHFVSSTQLTAPVLQTLIASAGTATVTVVSGGLTSNSETFTISAAPTPTISSISPDTITAGSAAFTLTVNGANFASGAAVKWNGSALPTSFVSSTQLTAAVPASDVASVGTDHVTATSGGVTSNSVNFTVTTAPTPTISSISPTTITAGSAAFNMTVNGSNFASGAAVKWNGTALPTSLVSSTQLIAAVPASDVASTGTDHVTVTSGGLTSNATTFTVTAAPPGAPTISSISPTSITGGTGAGLGAAGSCPSNVSPAGMLTINGSNFAAGATAKWNGDPLVTTVVSANQLTACVPSGFIQGYGTASITVSSGGKTTNVATISLTLPSIALTGLQTTSVPTQQLTVGIQMGAAAAAALSGTLQLSFSPNATGVSSGYRDPALQFSSGGTTLNFTIGKGASSVAAGTLAQGTVAGTITVTLTSLTANGSSVLPSSPVSGTVGIPQLAPVITTGSVQITNLTSSGFDVVLTGYSTSREMNTATFSFTAASGTQFSGTTTFAVDVSSAFTTWYANSGSQPEGSLFELTVPFTISGPTNVLGSVSVTLTNSVGTSAPASATP